MSLAVPKLSNSLSEFNLSHSQNPSLKSLPEELMVNIFKLLSINDLNSLVKTCRRFYTISKDNQPLWKYFFRRDFPQKNFKEDLNVAEQYKTVFATQKRWEKGLFKCFRFNISDLCKFYNILFLSGRYMVCNASDPIRCKETGYSNAECFQIWDVQEGSLVQSFDFQGWDLEECINDKDVFIGIATCGIGGEARIWSKASGELMWKVDCFPRLMLDNHILIGVKYDPMNFSNATIQLWRKFDGTPLLSINAPNLNHWSLFFDVDYLIGLTNDGIINIWDKNSGEVAHQSTDIFSKKICLICPLEDQSEFLCIDEDTNAFVLDKKKGQPKTIFSAVEQKASKTFHKPFFDQEVLVVSTDNHITCWDRSNQEVLFHFGHRVAQLLGLYDDHIIFWHQHGPIQIIDKRKGETLNILEIQHTVPTHRKLRLNDLYLFVLNTETNVFEIWNKYKGLVISKIENILDFEIKDDIMLLVFTNGKVQTCDFSFRSNLPIESNFSLC